MGVAGQQANTLASNRGGQLRRYKEDLRTALPKLPAGRHKTLYVDPPWVWMRGGTKRFTPSRGANVGREFHSVGTTPYDGLSTKELIALGPQIQRVSAVNSHLYLWTVNKTVPDAIKLVEAGGFRWVTMITWDKGRAGIAKYFRGMTEHCVFAVRGSLPYKFIDGKMAQGHTLVSERRTDHSRKPTAMREVIERVSYGPYLELFARRNPSKKWDAVGLELEGLQ